jgi:gliding motility-associatede transport system auxiliary component
MSSQAVTRPSFSVARRWSISLSVLLSLAAMAAIVVMVNYLALRYYKRIHWTANEMYKLSPLTEQVLHSLTNEVKVTLFFDRQEPLYRAVAALINEYRAASPKIVVKVIDYLQDPGAGELFKQNYKFSFVRDKNVVIFESNRKVKTVLEKELSEYDWSGLMSGATNEIKRTGFKGEQLFTSAIRSVVDLHQPKAYFLRGHGEVDPANEDLNDGYSKFADLLKQNSVLWERLALSGTTEIPTDCQLLIIAGPKESFNPGDVEKLEKYLDQGGRVLALLGTTTKPSPDVFGLGGTFAKWGVDLGENWVIDPPHSVGGGWGFLTTNFISHPIVKPLYDSYLYVVLPRSVEKQKFAKETADAARVEPLFATSPTGRVLTSIRNGAPNPTVRDRFGSIPLAVAVEKGSIQGVTANRGSTRMVIVGESLFLNNSGIISANNYDFAQLILNWLLDRPWLLSLGPRPNRDIVLAMTKSQMETTRLILLGGMPGGILLFGLLVWWGRRH